MSEPLAATAGQPFRIGGLDWWIRNRRTGRIALAQWPNAALGIWLVTVVAGWLSLGSGRAAEIRWIGTGALLAWALDEVLRGASPARRLLGLIVLGSQLYRLLG